MEYLANFQHYREGLGLRLKNTDVYDTLPFHRSVQSDGGWRLKRYDVSLLERLMPNDIALDILDLGAWNGWLSNVLAQKGHRPLAADYFVDGFDGLGAVQHYHNTFPALVMDVEDLHIIDMDFDAIVLNRGFAYLGQRTRTINTLKALLRSGGFLLLTGITVYRWPGIKMKRVSKERADFVARYGKDLFNKDCKGHHDMEDVRWLQNQGFQVSGYPELWKQNSAANVLAWRPWYGYALWRKQV